MKGRFQCKDLIIEIEFIRRKYGLARWDFTVYLNGRISAGAADYTAHANKMENAVNVFLNHAYDNSKWIEKHTDIAKKKRDGTYVFNLKKLEESQ